VQEETALIPSLHLQKKKKKSPQESPLLQVLSQTKATYKRKHVLKIVRPYFICEVSIN